MELRVPKNLLEFEAMYSTEEQCVEALQVAHGGRKGLFAHDVGQARELGCLVRR